MNIQQPKTCSFIGQRTQTAYFCLQTVKHRTSNIVRPITRIFMQGMQGKLCKSWQHCIKVQVHGWGWWQTSIGRMRALDYDDFALNRLCRMWTIKNWSSIVARTFSEQFYWPIYKSKALLGELNAHWSRKCEIKLKNLKPPIFFTLKLIWKCRIINGYHFQMCSAHCAKYIWYRSVEVATLLWSKEKNVTNDRIQVIIKT